MTRFISFALYMFAYDCVDGYDTISMHVCFCRRDYTREVPRGVFGYGDGIMLL